MRKPGLKRTVNGAWKNIFCFGLFVHLVYQLHAQKDEDVLADLSFSALSISRPSSHHPFIISQSKNPSSPRHAAPPIIFIHIPPSLLMMRRRRSLMLIVHRLRRTGVARIVLLRRRRLLLLLLLIEGMRHVLDRRGSRVDGD
jgi:hypothetical protein